jgi:hypothetical protein
MAGEDGTGNGKDATPPAPDARVSKRVTLKFAGPPLSLPGEPPKPEGPPTGQLRLDTGEFHASQPPADPMPPDPFAQPLSLDTSEFRIVAPKAAPPAPDGPLELDLDDEPADPGGDGWTRSSPSSTPARPKSTAPPPAEDDALDLVSKRSKPPSTPGLDLAAEMAERFALGDFSGALRVAELLLGRDPGHAGAARYADESRQKLIQLHAARLASATGTSLESLAHRVPEVAVPEHEIRWLGLDHRQGFLLSRLDGRATVEDLVDVTGMTRLEVLQTLVELVDAKAVRLT